MQSVNTHDLARLAKVASVCGFDIDDVLNEIGVSASDHADPESLWDARALARLYDAAGRRSTKAYFPFVLGEYFLFDRAPEVEAFLATCSTLQEALSIFSYLPYLVQPDTVGWQIKDEEHLNLYIELLSDGRRLDNPGYIETCFVAMAKMASNMVNEPVAMALSFRHRPLQAMRAYVQQFGIEPEFGGGSNHMTLKLADVERLRRAPSPILQAKSRLLLEARLQRLQARSGLEQTVDMMICQAPSLSMPELCLRLGLEPRSFQRRLREVGSSFSVIQAEARFKLARLMLADPALDIDSIAIKLGFSDHNGFSKAFAKWSGVSPSRYRRGKS